MIYEKKISDHPAAEGVNRFIQIIRNYNYGDRKKFEMIYRLKYVKDEIDVSSLYDTADKVWIIDNSREMMQRDLTTFLPLLNPNFIEPEELEEEMFPMKNDKYLMSPAYDYTMHLMNNMPIANSDLIAMYLAEEDADGRFN